MSAEWFQQALDTWMYQGSSPSPALYCQLGFIGRTARLCCGTERSIHDPAPVVATGPDPLVAQLKAE
eukprot:93705-Amphidinium_carterae.1